jgi:pheromone shutdown protein TraB
LQAPGHTEAQASALLEQRDRFIARRIAETLGEHELGILFIGALHRVNLYLPQQIAVEYLPIERG